MTPEYKETWSRQVALLAVILSTLVGCANLNTINRETSLKSAEDKGKAIHLDIQQRLLVVNHMDKYCAEPSPDGLAAFAATVGIGASTPTQGALSVAAGSSSSAAAIGLRTQSITLMRDALDRMCEAYGNGMLTKPQVMAMLSRSQDLTAVVLDAMIVEQVRVAGTVDSFDSKNLNTTHCIKSWLNADEPRKRSRITKVCTSD